MFTEEYRKTWISSGMGWNFRLIKTLGTFAVWKSKRLFIDSLYWKKLLLQRFPLLGKKAVVIPCGMQEPSPPVTKKPSWVSNFIKDYFLYVGVFSDNKNQFRLLEVWKQLQETYDSCPALILIGPCREDYNNQRINPIFKQLPRKAEVILPGAVSDEDLAWAYQNALGYLQPSFMEGFGMPIIEAMGYGIPVACSDTTSLPETAGGASLLFSPHDTDSICDTVMALWKDGALRQRLTVEGRRRSLLFTWEKHALSIAAEIEKVLTDL
jgi:glycosyltransferase involved in cell wall biosynthesis